MTSGAGLVSIVEGAELTVPGFPHPAGAAPNVEPNVVVVRGAVDWAAVDLLPGPAELVVPVDLVLVDLMQDRDLAAVKAELAADPIQSLGIGHVARCAAGDALGQVGVLLLGDVVGVLVRTKLREVFADWYDDANNEQDENCVILEIRITSATIFRDHGAVRYKLDLVNKVEVE